MPALLFAAVHKTKWNFKNYFNCPKNTSIFHFILGSDGFLHIYRIKRTNKNDLTLAQKKHCIKEKMVKYPDEFGRT